MSFTNINLFPGVLLRSNPIFYLDVLTYERVNNQGFITQPIKYGLLLLKLYSSFYFLKKISGGPFIFEIHKNSNLCYIILVHVLWLLDTRIIIIAKYNKITFKNSLIIPKEKTNFVVPKIIHTSPTEGIFLKTPLPVWKFQSKLIHLLTFLGL